MRLEEFEIGRVLDWKIVSLEECNIGRLLERHWEYVSLWFSSDLQFFEFFEEKIRVRGRGLLVL